MENIKLYTAFHKPFYVPAVDFIVPVWAGKDHKEIPMNIAGDDTGDNISHLNSTLSEMTVLYWVWKNVPMSENDIWGFCHYRRYFTASLPYWRYPGKNIAFKKPLPKYIDRIVNNKLRDTIRKKMETSDVIVHHPVNVSLQHRIIISIEKQYKINHVPEDWDEMKKVILELYPEYKTSLEKFIELTDMSLANMMIARAATWDKYLSWIFPVLFETQKRIPLHDDVYQKRAVAFMAERLMNLYILHNELRTSYLPIAVFNR